VLEDNSQRTKWKVISPTGNEAMVPSVCFSVPPPNQEAIDTASRSDRHYKHYISVVELTFVYKKLRITAGSFSNNCLEIWQLILK